MNPFKEWEIKQGALPTVLPVPRYPSDRGLADNSLRKSNSTSQIQPQKYYPTIPSSAQSRPLLLQIPTSSFSLKSPELSIKSMQQESKEVANRHRGSIDIEERLDPS